MEKIKIISKYEDFMTIVLSQIWGHEPRNLMCKDKVIEYIKTVEEIVKEGMQKGEIIEGDPEIIASRNIWTNMFKSDIQAKNKARYRYTKIIQRV